MEIINAIVAFIGKVVALLIVLGAFLTGMTPNSSPTPTQPPVAAITEPMPAATTTPAKETSQQSSAQAEPKSPEKSLAREAAAKTAARDGRSEDFLKDSSVQPIPTKSQEQINNETRAALVNIFCLPIVGINGASGSGVVVDSRGVILTNAHVAQYFLLRDYQTPGNITCTIRIGSPAQERYTATLLYLPPSWVATNAQQLVALQATGTGEHDYAFLLITGRTDPSASLPASFDRLEMDRGYVQIGEQMLLAAYPAGFLSSQLLQKSLYASSAIAYVTQLFSFDNRKRVDLFSVGGTVVSQSGSSGGAAVRLRDGKLAGIIATETPAASTGERDLRAVSMAHIDDSLAAAGKGGVATLLSGDLSAKAAEFNAKVAPGLTAALEAALGKR